MFRPPLKFFPPRHGHGETGVCVCHICSSNMRLIGVEPHPFPNVSTDLFTYECICGELHTDAIRLQEKASSVRTNLEISVRH